MFCPQCGTESSADLKFCRTCGANLRVIGKAVTLSEAIARSDSVPSKIKDLVKNLKIEKVTDEVARAMEKMKQEIAHTADDHREWVRARTREEIHEHSRRRRKEKTAEHRREQHLTRGFITMFSGVGFGIFLYFLGHSVVLNLSPDQLSKIPFDLPPVLHVIWLAGLVPALSGLGRVIAGFAIRRDAELTPPAEAPLRIGEPSEMPPVQPPYTAPRDNEVTAFAARSAPDSVTDRTTNILEYQPQVRETDEIN